MIYFLLSAGARNLPDLTLRALVLASQAGGAFLLLRGPAARSQAWVRRLILVSTGMSGIVLILGFLLIFERVERHFNVWTGAGSEDRP